MSMYSDAMARAAAAIEKNKADLGAKSSIFGTSSAIAGFAQRYATDQVYSRLSSGMRSAVEQAVDVLDGNAIDVALNYVGKKFPGAQRQLLRERYLQTPTPLFGGLTPEEAIEIMISSMAGADFAMQNLFLVKIESALAKEGAAFNTFAVDVEYAPITVSGDKVKIGSTVVDLVTGNEPVELRMTMLDDVDGSIKSWFAALGNLTAGGSGLVGLPVDYAVKITLVHSLVGTASGGVAGSPSDKKYYRDSGIFRVANMDLSLSRDDPGLSRVNLTFSQIDTFRTEL